MNVEFKTVKLYAAEVEMEGSVDYESVTLLPGKQKYGGHTGTLSMFAAALFIVGEMTGSGILGVPQGLAQSGYSGIGLMVLCVVIASYTGLTLSRNWMHVRDQYPYFCAKPYQSIGYTAYGKAGEIIVQICATVTLTGGCCAYLLIAAKCLAKFLFNELHTDEVGFRTSVVIMGAVFLGIMIFGAGSESFFVAVFATLLSAVFSMLILYGMIKTGKSDPHKEYEITTKSWFLSFGKFLFAFGGHSAFPNFQKEMKNPRKFPGSILIAYVIKLILYIPIGITGMIYFGADVHSNILDNISSDFQALNLCVLLVVAVQAIMSATILGNPVATMIEGLCRAPLDRLSWKRVGIRTGFVALAVAICEAIPCFDLIMALIGGTTINAAVFILPSLFHMKLAKRDKWHTFKITLDSLSIIFGAIAGVVCTYAALAHIIDAYR